MRLDVQMKGKSMKRNKSVERSASVNEMCRDKFLVYFFN